MSPATPAVVRLGYEDARHGSKKVGDDFSDTTGSHNTMSRFVFLDYFGVFGN